jgi:hypothetical protein
LLGGALSVFSWLNPQRAAAFPEWVWEKFGVRNPSFTAAESEDARANLLADRPHELAQAK